ncbi:MAG: OmpA family protein [Cyclobacteriaceae bacterium]
MKKITLIVVLSFMVGVCQAQLCCNVVSGNGTNVVTTNGICVVAPNSLGEGDCEGTVVDSDGDGVPDDKDDCPHEIGTAENDGCPELDAAEKKVLQDALQGVKFKTGSAELLSDSYEKLDKVVLLMKKHEDFKLKISGYTDNTGNAEINRKLSDDRAHSCEKYIIDHGIDASRIMAQGYGDSNPIADNNNDAGRAQNRRVEFELVH